MIIVDCAQGSPKWHEVRAGVITASMFSVARERINGLDARQRIYVDAILAGTPEPEARERAGYKAAPTSDTVRRAIRGEKVGGFSCAARDYAFRLGIERISGKPLDEGGFETYAMRRGYELEPEAREAHEIDAGVVVQRAGFVLTDDRAFGASADGLIGEHGGSEYKCLIAPDRLRSVLIDGDLSEFADQVQGCMWITGRRWWHFALYCPALASIGRALWWREWKRDDDYIEAMESELLEFKELVDMTEDRLRADGAELARAA